MATGAAVDLQADPDELIPLHRWAKSIDKTACTLWSWRQRGMIQTVNVNGKVYITRGEVQRFYRRAAAGEFSKAPTVPHPPKARKEGAQ